MSLEDHLPSDERDGLEPGAELDAASAEGDTGDPAGLGDEPADGATDAGHGWVPSDLVDRVYEDLREIAGRFLKRERVDHTLQPTALVHEAYLRLSRQDQARWRSPSQFKALSASEMYRVLVDYGRAKKAAKRGGDRVRIPLSDDLSLTRHGNLEFETLNQALERLHDLDQECHIIIVQHYFGGMTYPEIASLIGRSEGWVRKRATWARAWLRDQMDDNLWAEERAST